MSVIPVEVRLVETAKYDIQLFNVPGEVVDSICNELCKLPYSEYDTENSGILFRIFDEWEVLFIRSQDRDRMLISIAGIRRPLPDPKHAIIKQALDWFSSIRGALVV